MIQLSADREIERRSAQFSRCESVVVLSGRVQRREVKDVAAFWVGDVARFLGHHDVLEAAGDCRLPNEGVMAGVGLVTTRFELGATL